MSTAMVSITIGDLLLIDKGRGFDFNIKMVDPDTVEILMHIGGYGHTFRYSIDEGITTPTRKDQILAQIQHEAERLYQERLSDKAKYLINLQDRESTHD